MKVKYNYWQKIIDVYQISGKTVKDFIYDGVYFTEKILNLTMTLVIKYAY